jgi:hypothetical protein
MQHDDESAVTSWLGWDEANVKFAEHTDYGCVKTMRLGSDSFRIVPLPWQWNDPEGV